MQALSHNRPHGAGPNPTNSPSNPLVIPPHLVRDLVGFAEDRRGFRGGFVGEVLEGVGDGERGSGRGD
jgi:hypothetical protein